MRTYREFVSLLEQVTGATLGFKRTFGAPIGRSTSVTGSVQGGSAKGTEFSASGSLGRGTVSGQGDRISQGIDAAIKNYQSGSDNNTSTSTIRKGVIGSLNAKVSGGGAKPAEPQQKPEEKPQPEQKPSTITRTVGPVTRTLSTVRPTPSGQASRPIPTSSQPGTYKGSAGEFEDRAKVATSMSSGAKDMLDSMAAIDRSRVAKGLKPHSDVLSKFPGRGL